MLNGVIEYFIMLWGYRVDLAFMKCLMEYIITLCDDVNLSTKIVEKLYIKQASGETSGKHYDW